MPQDSLHIQHYGGVKIERKMKLLMRTEEASHWRVKAAVLAFALFWSSALLAQDAPQPPCSGSPQPPYAENGDQPNFEVWGKTRLALWTPPPCTGWTDGVSNLLVALAGTFSYAGSTDGLLNRFGAVSAMHGIRYWSVTDKGWRDLVIEASAVDGPDSKIRRPDFTALEMKSGRDLFFAQRDSRSSGEVVYKMRVREAGAYRLVLEVENVTRVRAFLVMTVFKPGGMKFLYFLERRASGNWGFYALLSANSSYAKGNEASFINRAAAFYRHFTGVPTDGAPPLAH